MPLGMGNCCSIFPIPLPYSPGDNKFAGSYQFYDNQFDFGLEVPYLEKIIVENIVNLEKVNGVLTFTDSEINTEKIRAQILGGPVTISSTILSTGGIQLTAIGKANFDNLSRPTGSAQLRKKYIHGGADWSAVFKIHDNLTDMSIESSLQGIASDLPEPFSKRADDIVPLRLEKKSLSLRQDIFNGSYGNLVAAKIVRLQNDTGDNYSYQGILGFSAASLMLPEEGVLLVGSLPKLELDHWRDIFRRFRTFEGSNERGGFYSDLTGINLHIGILDFLGRRFNDVAFDAGMNNKEWYATVLGKEIEGKVNWYPHDEGKVLARLKKLIVPSVAPAARPTEPNIVKKSEKEFTALDVIVDKTCHQRETPRQA